MIKIAQIGVANFGAYRRSQLRNTGRFNIVALCDRNPAALADAAAREKAQPYDDFELMLDHPDVEGVVISTGADSHAALAIAALRRGKHVFVEKPLCCSVDEVQALRTAAGESRRVVVVGHNHCPTHPIYRIAKSWANEGRLGTVVAYEENRSHSGGLEIQPGDWRGLSDRNPGGMLFQCGVKRRFGCWGWRRRASAPAARSVDQTNSSARAARASRCFTFAKDRTVP